MNLIFIIYLYSHRTPTIKQILVQHAGVYVHSQTHHSQKKFDLEAKHLNNSRPITDFVVPLVPLYNNSQFTSGKKHILTDTQEEKNYKKYITQHANF